jgi:hypothetical protein
MVKERVQHPPLTRLNDGSADPQAVADWSAHLSDGYLMCRDMGHTWRPFKANYQEDMNAYNRVLRCGRCKTERYQTIGLNGLILGGNYSYPDGYQSPAGSGRINGEGKGALRLESTLRLIGKDEHDG